MPSEVNQTTHPEPEALSKLRMHVGRWCAAAVGVLATFTIAVRLAGVTQFGNFGSSATMAPSTALVFGLLGAALMLATHGTTSRTPLPLIITGLAALATTLVLASRIQGSPHAWELRLIALVQNAQDASPERRPLMRSEAAAMLLMLSVAVATLFRPLAGVRGLVLLRIVGNFVALLVSIAILVNHTVARVATDVGMPFIVLPTPIPTALGLGLLAIAIIAMGQCDRAILRVLTGSEAEDTDVRWSRRRRITYVVISVAFLFALASTAVAYLRIRAGSETQSAQRELLAAAEAKLQQVTAWRQGNLREALRIGNSGSIAGAVEQLTANRTDASTADGLRGWMRELIATKEWSGVTLLSRQLTPLLSEPATSGPLDPTAIALLEEALREGSVHELTAAKEGLPEWRLLLAVPLITHHEHAVVGAVLLTINPAESLWPLLRGWAGSPKSTECALWLRTGETYTNLSPLAQPENDQQPIAPPLSLVRRISSTGQFGSRVLRGETSVVSTTDSRGIKVLAAGRIIPGTPWFITFTTRLEEVFAPLREEAVKVTIVALAIIGLAAAFTGLVLRQRDAANLRLRLRAKKEQVKLAQRLQLLLGHANDGFLLFDPDLRIIEANERAAQLYQYGKPELLRLTLGDLHPSSSSPEEQVARVRRVGLEGAVFETSQRRRDGTIFPAEVSARVVEIEGREHYAEIVRDITNRKRVQAESARTRAELEDFFSLVPDLVCIVSKDGRLLKVNQAWSAVLGYRPEALVGQAFLDLVHPDDRVATTRQFENDLLGLRTDQFVNRYLHQDGSHRWLEWTSQAGPDGRIYGAARDITEYRSLQEAEHQSRQRVAEAQQLAKLGSWDLDLQHQRLSWTSEVFRMLELEHERPLETSDSLFQPVSPETRVRFLQRIHPDDLERVDATFTSSIESRQPYEIIHRLRLPDGRIKVVQQWGRTTYDASGAPVRAVGSIMDITEREAIQENLRLSEQRLSAVFENADVGICYSGVNVRPSLYNNRLCAMLGYSKEELRGLSYQSFTHPEDFLREAEEMKSIISGRSNGYRMEKRYVRKDGSQFWGSLALSALRSKRGELAGFVIVVEDVTEKRKARATLESLSSELERRVAARTSELEGLIRSIPDVVLICNQAGTILSCHWPRPEERPAYWRKVDEAAGPAGVPAAGADAARDACAAMPSPQNLVLERSLEFEGRSFWIEVRATAVDASRVMVLLRDITQRKQLELDIQANLERTVELAEMRSGFVSVASHEFRTPLTGAVASLEMLERFGDRMTAEKRDEIFGRLKRSHDRLTSIMDDLLKVSRADSGQVPVTPSHVDLNPFVQDLIREVAHGDRQQHHFSFEPAGGAAHCTTDARLLHHILANLLSNAVKYSPPHSTVTVKLAAEPSSLILTVADEGVGIPEKDRSRLFEPFARGSNVEHIAGTGLGLNIVRRYTDLLGGTIKLVPSDRGAVFRLELPRTVEQPLP